MTDVALRRRAGQAGDEEDEEEAKENEEVKKIEKMLERHGESIKAPSVTIKNPLFDLSTFFMATERVRVPEIFFQVRPLFACVR